ncbi:hypothetical protein ABL78_0056 [Leptomonas seymouri]|uniref:Uncharacterized protein n=1 Tax=Leptomonas seymouri TaxID=5684 RepID=A0A0N1I2J2_LEPSE|nr:hypothetical protein ABL78_0056 [Leptomonas seymouri]|eukprot:KPI90823.1 hypothetical protein ABL78_0056 [Leptomonas seymouri]
MIVNPLGAQWTTDNVAELFSADDVGLRDVLYAEAVTDYLQSIQVVPVTGQSPRRGGLSMMKEEAVSGPLTAANRVRCVLRYIHVHSEELFALLQGNAELHTANKAVLAEGGELPNPVVGCAEHADDKLEFNSGDNSIPPADSSCEENGSPCTFFTPQDVAGEAFSAEDLEHRLLINLTELLSFCIGQSSEQSEVNAVVSACTVALSCAKTLEAQRAFAVQRLLLEAFDSDFETTTQAIADALTPAVITGVVENLASNSIIAETLIALFGSALSAVWMVRPTTKTALFTSRWIELSFPTVLCAYLPIAISDPGMYHYFYFFKELLKRGYSHSAGPVVDVLLGEPLVSSYVESILHCCECDLNWPPLFTPEGSVAPPVSLAADGMEVLASIVSLVRKSLVLPESKSMYETSIQYITPLKVLLSQANRITALLDLTEREKAQPAAHSSSRSRQTSWTRQGLGPLRLAVCELFVELSLFQLAEVDRTLISSNFFPAFFACCERFPQHDALARCLHRCILAVFERATLMGESLSDAGDRDMLWKYFVQPETVRLACGRMFSIVGALTHLAEVSSTSLSSHCIDMLTNLAPMPLFQAVAGGPLEDHLAAFRSSRSIQKRVHNMSTPITGKDYENPGSADLPQSAHRDTINLAGDRFHGSRTGGVARSSRLSDVAKKVSNGAYVIVRHSSSDDRPQRLVIDDKVDIEALKQEVHDLQEAGSPQVRSYPSFSSVNISFFSDTEEQPVDEAAKKHGKSVKVKSPLVSQEAPA